MPQNEDTEVAEEALNEILDFNKPSFNFQPNEAHSWRQRGPFLVCKSCDIEHASYIGPGKLMTGIDKKGMPILKRMF